MLLGCIGDDFTGSSDLANTLAKQGMRTVQYTGIPNQPAATDIEAGVVALKSRSIDAKDAVAQSLAALQWLQEQGCEQFFFKYCSTFDSTAQGNIGPVADALAEALDAHQVVVCPAFPGTGRSVYQGHLFVNDRLLNESGMQNHPLTPMTDADLRRCLAAQSRHSVGHVAANDVLAGPETISQALDCEHRSGHRFIVVDALRDDDLYNIGLALNGSRLITGGSGIALGLPDNFDKRGLLSGAATGWQGESGQCVALSGSCSIATRNQVHWHKKNNPYQELDAQSVIEKKISARELATWATRESGIPMIYSSADPAIVKQTQERFGRETSAFALEAFFAELACELVAMGVSRILTAGGETSGAVVEVYNFQPCTSALKLTLAYLRSEPENRWLLHLNQETLARKIFSLRLPVY